MSFKMNPDWRQIVRKHLAALQLPPHRERDIVEEVAQHLEAIYEEALERGESEQEALAQTLRRYDWSLLECELSRVERLPAETFLTRSNQRRIGELWMESLLQDVRYSIRLMAKQPGIAFLVVLTLALGIGTNTAIFSVANAVLLRALPYAGADRLMMIWETHPDVRGPVGTYLDFLDWRAQAQSFQEMVAFSTKGGRKMELTGRTETVEAQATMISHDLFPLLGIHPMLGRNFLSAEEESGNNRVVILSRALWSHSFGSDPGIIGKSIRIDGAGFTVVGVMDVQFPLETDFWLPLSHLTQKQLTDRRYHSIHVIGRLKHGVSIEQARSEMRAIAERLQQLYLETNRTVGVELMPLSHQLAGNLRPIGLLVFAALALILLIACANVSNLLLAQVAGRQRELAIRAALGAGRCRLVRQLLLESLLLALLGGVAGLVLAAGCMPLLRSELLGIVTGKVPGLESIGIDWRTLAFTGGVSCLTGLLFGVLPALQVSRIDLNQTLKEGGKSLSGGGRHNLNRTLVAVQVALAIMVLIGAGLLIRSFNKLLQVDPGFRADHLLSLRIELPQSRYQKDEQVRNFYQQLLPRVEALPGVERVASIDYLPLAPLLAISKFVAEGQQPESGKEPLSQLRAVDHRFFEMMRIPLHQGRLFNEADVVKELDFTADGNEVIINETMTQRFFPKQDPIGKRIYLHWGLDRPTAVVIVGVVADIKDLGLDLPVEPEIYWPSFSREAVLLLRTAGDPTSFASAVRQTVLSADPSLPLQHPRSIEEIISASLARRRFTLGLLGASALLALLLAAIGIYGVTAYSITRRIQEIGIRMAMGAGASDILQLVIRHGLAPVLFGVACGLAGAFALSRLLASLMTGLLFETRATDPVTFAGMALLLLIVSSLACYVPARRATKVDPLIALRHD